VDLLELAFLLVIAGICGAIAQWIVAFSPGSLLVSIIIGVVGAYLGSLIGNLLPIPNLLAVGVDTVEIDLVWAILGSMLLLFLLKTLRTSGPRFMLPRR
jgi:uncharacterized membrane protein YeaQ/YmgE (transglycosylase-associated protein family)